MEIAIIDGFKFQLGINDSKKLIIESSKLDDCIKYILDKKVKVITINSYQGYKLSDISFLTELSNVLEGVHLPETKFDIHILNSLHNLKYLGFSDNKKDIVDLTNFPNLEILACDFSTRLKGLETCTKLKNLALTSYKIKSKNLSELPLFVELKNLLLIRSDIQTLEGIERFQKLEKLEIFMSPKLEKITALQNLSNTLKEVQIEKSKKIQDFEILEKIKSIEKLILSDSGEIQNLAFVKELPNLKFISFWGTNVLDGDISYCEGIDYVGFDNKKHYTHKMEQFKISNKKQ